jgi:hypothetical protein
MWDADVSRDTGVFRRGDTAMYLATSHGSARQHTWRKGVAPFAVMVSTFLFLAACGADSSSPPAFTAAGGSAISTAGTSAPVSIAAGSAAPAGAAGGATFTAVLAILANTDHNCVICHSGAPSASNGSFQFVPTNAAMAYAQLVGKVSAGGAGSKCGGKTYVAAGAPDTSLLLEKVGAAPSCGAPMPLGSSFKPLSAAELDTIRGWIAAGAPNN